MFGKDYKAQVEELEDEVSSLKRDLKKAEDEITYLNGLKYSHKANLEREDELDERERQLEKTESEIDLQIKAKQDAIDIQNKARQVQVDAAQNALIDREARLIAREKRVQDQTETAVKAAMHEGYASGLKDGLSKLGELRSLDAANAQELLKLHTVGAHLPATVKEDEDNPMATAYAELGTKLVTKLMDTDSKKDK
jgi:hypothetical protein